MFYFNILLFCEGRQFFLQFRLIEWELQFSVVKRFSTRKKYVCGGDKKGGAKCPLGLGVIGG